MSKGAINWNIDEYPSLLDEELWSLVYSFKGYEFFMDWEVGLEESPIKIPSGEEFTKRDLEKIFAEGVTIGDKEQSKTLRNIEHFKVAFAYYYR